MKNAIITVMRKSRVIPKENLYTDKSFIRYVYRKKRAIELNQNHIRTLAFRGSQADYSVIGSKENGIYNAGLTSSDLFINYHLYKNTTKTLPNIENIVVFIGVFSPGHCLIKTSEKYRCVHYKHLFGIPYQHDGYIRPFWERFISKKIENISVQDSDAAFMGYDFDKKYMIKADPRKRALVHLRENKRLPSQLIWLERILELSSCKKHRCIVIIPPVREDYRQHLPKKDVLFSLAKQICAGRAEVVDYYDSPLFDAKHFGDTDHLNELGARILTSELEKLLIASRK